jgi:hypothetical protein
LCGNQQSRIVPSTDSIIFKKICKYSRKVKNYQKPKNSMEKPKTHENEVGFGFFTSPVPVSPFLSKNL